LKKQPGKDVALFGSADLASTFIRFGLIDEYRIFVTPVLLGEGTPMFKDPTASRRNFMDEELNQMTPDELIDEVKKLRQGIRRHRDSSRHELCWHHPSLWGLLPEKTDPIPVVPEWPEFIRGCVRYRQSLDEQATNAPRMHEPYRE
jgi:hypothetical protein